MKLPTAEYGRNAESEGHLDVMGKWTSKVSSVLGSPQGHASRHRKAYIALGFMVLSSGLVASVWWLDLNLSDIRTIPLLINVALGAPLAFSSIAWGLLLNGRILGVKISFPNAFRVSVIATASNVLPIPAATAIHAGALLYHGASVSRSVSIVLLGHVAMLGLIASVFSIALTETRPELAWSFLLSGMSAIALACIPVFRFSRNPLTLAGFLLQKMIRMAVMVVRLELSFLAVGAEVSPFQAAALSAGLVLGTSASIVPSGLGVSELFAAVIATIVAVNPATAFVATAVNRVSTLGVAVFLSLIFRRTIDAEVRLEREP